MEVVHRQTVVNRVSGQVVRKENRQLHVGAVKTGLHEMSKGFIINWRAIHTSHQGC